MKWLAMAGNGWKWLEGWKWLDQDGMAGNGWNLLEICGKGWTFVERAGNSWKYVEWLELLEMTEHGLKWLESV